MKAAVFGLALGLSGCAGGLTWGELTANAPGLAQNATGSLDSIINLVILQKAADIHNLEVSLAEIQAAPGRVMMVMPSPIVTQPPLPSMSPVIAVPPPSIPAP